MEQSFSLNDKIKRGAEDSGRYFRYMADFVGFTEADAEAIKDFEKYLGSGNSLEFQKEATEKLGRLKAAGQAQSKQP